MFSGNVLQHKQVNKYRLTANNSINAFTRILLNSLLLLNTKLGRNPLKKMQKAIYISDEAKQRRQDMMTINAGVLR